MSSKIPYFKSIEEYNFRISIDPPRYDDFDVRDFKDTMKTVRLKMPPFRLSFFQIALLESGGGTVSSDGKNYDLDNFTLFFNLPSQIIYWDVIQDWKGFFLSVSDSFYTVQLEEFKSLYNLPFFRNYTPSIKLIKEEAALVLEMMQRMHQEYAHPTPYNKAVIKSYLSTILSYCVRFFDRENLSRHEESKNTRLSDRFKELVRYRINALIADVGSREMTIAQCADELFVTPKYLSEIIKRDLGVTPTEYINNRLIDEAQRLLLTSNFQIKEVAIQLGFTDPSYFNRLFKKITGKSPAEFRKSKG